MLAIAAIFLMPPLPGDHLSFFYVALLLALAAVGGSHTVQLIRSPNPSEKGSLSIGFLIAFTSLLTLGLRACLLAAVVSGVSAGLFPRRLPLHQILFNAASLALTAWATGYAYAALNGGHVGAVSLASAHAVLAALVYFTVNSLLVAGVITLCSHCPFRTVWRSFLWIAPSSLAGAAAAMATVLLLGVNAGIMLFLPVLAFVYQSYNTHIRDTDLQERYLEELRRSEERFQQFMAHVPAAAWITDAEGHMVYLNRAYTTISGLTAEAALNRNIFDLFDPETARKFFENNRRVLESGQVLETEEAVPNAKETHTNFLIYRFPVTDASGVTLVGGVAVDLTERSRLEEQLRQSQKMEGIGQLAGGIAHDFNNLLSAILGYTELAKLEAEADSETDQHLDHIQQAAERAAGLTKQLLAFARRQRIEPQRVNPGILLSSLAPILRRLINEDIELSVVLHEEVLWVWADPNQIEQVVINLAVNARDAMPRGGRLTIEMQHAILTTARAHIPPGDYILMTVSDTGVGITQEVKAHIFEPFFTTKEVGKGTGMGMATVYGIIQQSNGYILVDSEVGVGTNIAIYLPSAPDAVSESGVPIRDTSPLPCGSETVLVVEDEPLLRNLAVQTLQGLGYRVIEAQHGGEAVAMDINVLKRVNLLVTDMIMPQMGGQALAERLCMAFPSLKVLFVSGYSGPALARSGSRRLRAVLLEKPFTRDQLARKVREVLDSHTSQWEMSDFLPNLGIIVEAAPTEKTTDSHRSFWG
jgi:PAS domain S-box-containing protein